MRVARSFPLDLYYRITWQLVIALVGGLAIASGVVRPPVALPFFGLAFVLMTPFASRALQQRRKRLSYAIGFAIFLLTVNEILRLDRFEILVEAMIEIITSFLPLMLLNHDRPRSYWLALLDAAVIAVGSITFTSSVLIYLGFFAFIVVMLLNLNAANLHLPDAQGARLREDLPRGYFAQFLRAAPIGALSAAFIFVAFPRVQSFTMSLGALVAKSHTGYAGLISLDGGGEIETSKELAFLVDAKDKQWLRQVGPTLHFRGDSLDSFDGVHWTTSTFHFRARGRVPDPRVATLTEPDVHELTVHMEPTAGATIFYPGVLLSAVPITASAGQMMVNANGSVIRDMAVFERFDYALRTSAAVGLASLKAATLDALSTQAKGSEVGDPAPAELGLKDFDLYLAIPPAIRDAAWFKGWREEVDADPATETLAALAKHVDAYFASRFTASLENKFSSMDTLEAFLTKDHRGHCEYFATATVLLLRSLNVPARVVVGYKGGTYNKLIDMLEVREENAHAWVEAFVPGAGWYELDPTPTAYGEGADDFASTVHTYVNALSFLFRRYVVDYDQSTQRELVRSLRHIGDRGRSDKPLEWREALKVYGRPLLVLVVLGAVGWALTRVKRQPDALVEVPPYYRAFEARLRRVGRSRAPGETYARFHARLRDEGVEAELLGDVDGALERDLYATAPLTDGERKVLQRRVTAR